MEPATARRPTSGIRRSGPKPKYIIADQGKEFICAAFKGWCRRRGIRLRHGVVGEHGSIAIIERFIRSMKFGVHATDHSAVPARLHSA